MPGLVMEPRTRGFSKLVLNLVILMVKASLLVLGQGGLVQGSSVNADCLHESEKVKGGER
ncbi:hypothetical protein DPZ05_22400 [Salmonella enterica subsp. enterica serovar Newport]|nr:hypothetical protein [Salmonella enterica subsp. enterica serovar Newport]EBW6447971.1 hypothetical protein [Salmonella enterica subsp. enterica serovar Newport]